MAHHHLHWKKTSEHSVRIGHRKILRKTFQLPNGKEDVFDVKDEPPVVCILALTPLREVILVRQYRPGPERMLLELPGGLIEQDQSPEEAAMRELLEETGYEGELTFVATRYHCGYSNRLYYSFTATNCVRTQKPTPDPTEFIEVVLVPLEEFRTHLLTGQLTDTVAGYAGLDSLGLL